MAKRRGGTNTITLNAVMSEAGWKRIQQQLEMLSKMAVGSIQDQSKAAEAYHATLDRIEQKLKRAKLTEEERMWLVKERREIEKTLRQMSGTAMRGLEESLSRQKIELNKISTSSKGYADSVEHIRTNVRTLNKEYERQYKRRIISAKDYAKLQTQSNALLRQADSLTSKTTKDRLEGEQRVARAQDANFKSLMARFEGLEAQLATLPDGSTEFKEQARRALKVYQQIVQEAKKLHQVQQLSSKQLISIARKEKGAQKSLGLHVPDAVRQPTFRRGASELRQMKQWNEGMIDAYSLNLQLSRVIEDVNFGIMGIANNLPMLTTQWGKATAGIANARKEGKKVPGIWKQIWASMKDPATGSLMWVSIAAGFGMLLTSETPLRRGLMRIWDLFQGLAGEASKLRKELDELRDSHKAVTDSFRGQFDLEQMTTQQLRAMAEAAGETKEEYSELVKEMTKIAAQAVQGTSIGLEVGAIREGTTLAQRGREYKEQLKDTKLELERILGIEIDIEKIIQEREGILLSNKTTIEGLAKVREQRLKASEMELETEGRLVDIMHDPVAEAVANRNLTLAKENAELAKIRNEYGEESELYAAKVQDINVQMRVTNEEINNLKRERATRLAEMEVDAQERALGLMKERRQLESEFFVDSQGTLQRTPESSVTVQQRAKEKVRFLREEIGLINQRSQIMREQAEAEEDDLKRRELLAKVEENDIQVQQKQVEIRRTQSEAIVRQREVYAELMDEIGSEELPEDGLFDADIIDDANEAIAERVEVLEELRQEAVLYALDVIQSGLTETELERARHEQTLSDLKSYLDQKLITQKAYNAAIEAEQKRHTEAMRNITISQFQQGAQLLSDVIGNMSSMMRDNYRAWEIARQRELAAEGKTAKEARAIIAQEGEKKVEKQRRLAKIQAQINAGVAASQMFMNVIEMKGFLGPAAIPIAVAAAASTFAAGLAAARLESASLGPRANFSSGGAGGGATAGITQQGYQPPSYGTQEATFSASKASQPVQITNVVQVSPSIASEIVKEGDKHIRRSNR